MVGSGERRVVFAAARKLSDLPSLIAKPGQKFGLPRVN